jgi:O-antigen/teichoic acid export membrane protein
MRGSPLGGRAKPGPLLQNAMALMISSGGTAVLGIVFWGLATHVSTPAVIGKTSAEIAAMVLIANLAQLSFGPIFERFLPVAGDQTRAFVKRAYMLCTLVALVMALAYVASGIGHRFLPSDFTWRALFVVAVVMWTIFVLQDSALIGLRASRWVPVENILFALAKLSLLPVLVIVAKTQGMFVAWTAPVAVSIIVVSWYLFTRRIPQHEAANASSERLPSTRELILLTGAQYTTLIIAVITSSIVTLYVIERLGPVANAHFYVPAQIAGGPLLLMWAITRSFLVEASHDRTTLRRHSNTTIKAMLLVLVPSIAIGVIFAPDILRIFGATYAEHGTTLLRMLLLALPGTAVTDFYSSYAWLDRHVWWMTLRQAIAAIIYFSVMIACIGHFGILAVGIASLVSSGIQGIFFLPISIRRYRQTSDSVPAS